MKLVRAAILFIALANLVVACSDNQKTKPYLKFMGGGLTFNYRYSKATMVVVVKTVSPIHEGGKIQAQFEIPGQLAVQIVEMPINPGSLIYKLESNPLLGIKKDVPLHVVVSVFDEKNLQLDQIKTQFVSDVDQDTLPTKPLMDPNKPGYVPLPENMK